MLVYTVCPRGFLQITKQIMFYCERCSIVYLCLYRLCQSENVAWVLTVISASDLTQLTFILLLSCQPRVTVTSCFVYEDIRNLLLIDYLCINPSASGVYNLMFYLEIVN